MNLIDWIVVGIIGVSVLIGVYRGFISSVASLGGCLVSLLASYLVTPKLVEFVTNSTTLRDTIASYTGASKLAGEAWASRQVGVLSEGEITQVVQSMQSKLPPPLDSLLEGNLKNQVFKSVTDMSQTVGEYVSKTIVDAVMNIICFLVAFILLTILFHLLINLLNAIFKFPVLKQMNTVAGGIFGLLRGALLCFVAFALLPLFQTILPDNVNALVQGSALAPVFNSRIVIESIIKGRL